MDNREENRILRKRFSKCSLAVLAYQLVFVIICALILLIPGAKVGYGYFLTSVVLLAAVVIMKRPKFFVNCCRQRRKMTPGRFFLILVMVVAGQAIYQTISVTYALISHALHTDLLCDHGQVADGTRNWALVLYVCVTAPILEECVFRGWFLKSVESCGKVFAIFLSALFFGLMHSDVVQLPFAFCMGLLFGYLTVEYSLIWALVFHMFNNLVLGWLLPVLLSKLSPGLGNSVTFLLYWLSAVVAILYLYVRRGTIFQYIRRNAPLRGVFRQLFLSVGIWIAISGFLLLIFLT